MLAVREEMDVAEVREFKRPIACAFDCDLAQLLRDQDIMRVCFGCRQAFLRARFDLAFARQFE